MRQLVYFFLFLLAGSRAWSQQVINSAGGYRVDNSSGISITDNVGEPFIQTASAANVMITEGYLQPFVLAPGFTAELLKNDLSCSDLRDGKISVKLSTHGIVSYVETYSWSPAIPCGNCGTADSLNTGTYTVTAFISYTTSAGIAKRDSSTKTVDIYSPNGPCQIVIHNAYTPDGDNVNDTWIIGNINAFPKNKVSIFNRWGEEVFSTSGYDNVSKVWPSSSDHKLMASTYFYIIDLGNGTKPFKGWVELVNK